MSKTARYSAQLPAETCNSIFETIKGYASSHIVPAHRAAPGDLLGLVLGLHLMNDKYSGYNFSRAAWRFIIMGGKGPEICQIRDLPEDMKNIAARISIEADITGWNHEDDLMMATTPLEDPENGLSAQIFVLPNLGLIARGMWEEDAIDLDPEDPGYWLSGMFQALRRPAESNHAIMNRKVLEAPDLATLNAIIEIPCDPEEDTSPSITLTLPQR